VSVTIKDVARHADVLPATVSRVLTQNDYVSEKTRDRVEKAVKELQYQPRATTRGIRKKQTLMVGLIIPDILNAYFATVAQSTLEHLTKRGCNLLILISNEDPELELDYLRMLLDGKVDGIIYVPVTSSKNSAIIRNMAAKGMPMIELSRRREANVLDAVLADNLGGSYMAVEQLVSLGHRRIALINNASTSSTTAYDRYLGYKQALEDHGVVFDETLVKMKEASKMWGIEATRMLLQEQPWPTAIFVASNRILVGVLTELSTQKVRVPEDISIITFDDPEWLCLCHPPITTVGVAVEENGKLAVQLLLKHVEEGHSGQKPVTYRLSVNLIERQSCARIAS
jgi:LacI family transcriptional regulator